MRDEWCFFLAFEFFYIKVFFFLYCVVTGGSLARKRPLLGVPRSSMNPTKRTVMTLLARAKNAQALHGIRTGVAGGIEE